MTNEVIGKEPCPKCRNFGGDKSGDNLVVYSDHKYCFACKLYVRTDGKLSIDKVKSLTNQGLKLKPLPDDASAPIGAIGWRWLKKYGLGEEDTEDMLWSDDKQWLIFTFRDREGQLMAWQARNFNPLRPKPKYYTAGNISDVFAFYGNGDTLVLVEDIVSAKKVGRSSGVVGMPIFGSQIPLKTIVRLSRRFKTVGIWLDMDKARESVLARSRASQYIPQTFTILTPKDPKEYDDKEITERILVSMLKSDDVEFDKLGTKT